MGILRQPAGRYFLAGPSKQNELRGGSGYLYPSGAPALRGCLADNGPVATSLGGQAQSPASQSQCWILPISLPSHQARPCIQASTMAPWRKYRYIVLVQSQLGFFKISYSLVSWGPLHSILCPRSGRPTITIGIKSLPQNSSSTLQLSPCIPTSYLR